MNDSQLVNIIDLNSIPINDTPRILVIKFLDFPESVYRFPSPSSPPPPGNGLQMTIYQQPWAKHCPKRDWDRRRQRQSPSSSLSSPPSCSSKFNRILSEPNPWSTRLRSLAASKDIASRSNRIYTHPIPFPSIDEMSLPALHEITTGSRDPVFSWVRSSTDFLCAIVVPLPSTETETGFHTWLESVPVPIVLLYWQSILPAVSLRRSFFWKRRVSK